MRVFSKQRQRGYSLVEMVVVIGIMFILSAFAILSTRSATYNSRANNAVATLVTQLRQARELAITKRRNVTVTLSGSNSIQMAVQTLPGEAAPTVYSAVQMNDGDATGLAYVLPPSGIPDTPMGFGNGSPINMTAANGGVVGSAIMFTTSGSLVGAGGSMNYYAIGNNDPVNLTIFIGDPKNSLNTTELRAITVMGSTGRVRAYSWDGAIWEE
jgi:prepilin-type N-terminal cleavage/methylation domain-containing protein